MTDKIFERDIHTFGVEDGSFKTFVRLKPSFTFLCGVETVMEKIVNVKLRIIEVDGFDATDKLLSMIDGMNLNAVILGGITFAGFNIINPNKILNDMGIPVIVYSGNQPNNEKMLMALKKHFNDWKIRWDIIKNLGSVYIIKPHPFERPIFFEVVGASPEWAKTILHRLAIISRIPEPVRIAGIIARGLSSIF